MISCTCVFRGYISIGCRSVNSFVATKAYPYKDPPLLQSPPILATYHLAHVGIYICIGTWLGSTMALSDTKKILRLRVGGGGGGEGGGGGGAKSLGGRVCLFRSCRSPLSGAHFFVEATKTRGSYGERQGVMEWYTVVMDMQAYLYVMFGYF